MSARRGAALATMAVALACGTGTEPAPAAAPPPRTDLTSTAVVPWAILSIDPASADVSTGASLQLAAFVGRTPAQGVSWSVLEGAAGGAVDANGTYSAPARTGTFHLTATVGSQRATSTLNVKAGGAIALRPSPAQVLPRASMTFSAIVTGLADDRVTWSLREGPTAGTIDATGAYTAAAHGTYHVVATSVSEPSVTAVAEVRVTADLEDLGGAIMPAPTVRALWWGTAQDFGDTADAVRGFLTNVNGSGWLANLEQYLRGAQARVSFGGDLFLPGTAPAGAFDVPAVVSAVCDGLDALGLAPDAQTIYVLFTPAVQTSGLWGIHSSGLCHGVLVNTAWISRRPYAAGCGNASPEAQAAVATVSHELAEAMTDPTYYRSWISWDDQEVGDRCAPSCVDLGGDSYPVSALWSNAAHGCVIQ